MNHTAAELRRIAAEIEQQAETEKRARVEGAVEAILWMIQRERGAIRIEQAKARPWRDRRVTRRLKEMGLDVQVLVPREAAVATVSAGLEQQQYDDEKPAQIA